MKTNYLMITELWKKYYPQTRGFVNSYEQKLIKDTLHLKEMDILALRNLRDFVVLYMGHSENTNDWDKMSAITYVIDSCIFDLGYEV